MRPPPPEKSASRKLARLNGILSLSAANSGFLILAGHLRTVCTEVQQERRARRAGISVDVLDDRVLPFYEEHGLEIERALAGDLSSTDKNGTSQE